MNAEKYLKNQLEMYFEDYSIKKISGGSTKAELFSICVDNIDRFVLKKQVYDVQKINLKSDYQNYLWLESKAPVPKVIFYKEWGKFEYLCMTKLSGQSLDYYFDKIEPKAIIEFYAIALKRLHSLPINNGAPVQQLESKLANAGFNVEHDLVDISEFQPENRNSTPKKLFAKLLSLQPSDHQLVFTHGDYCFENIIFEDNKLSGYIDIGNGGVADMYQDIAIAVRNIKNNFNPDMVDLFYEVYGLNTADRIKLEFYTLLDEFF